MKKIKSLILSLSILFILGISMPVGAYSDGIITNLETNATELKKGEEVEASFSLKSNDGTDKEINAFKATLEYNENLFEEIGQDDFEVLGSWKEFVYNPKNKQFIMINKSGKIKDETVIKVKLRAKNDISSVKTAIKVKDVVTSDGNDDIPLKDSEVQFETGSGETQGQAPGQAQGQTSGQPQGQASGQGPNSDVNTGVEVNKNDISNNHLEGAENLNNTISNNKKEDHITNDKENASGNSINKEESTSGNKDNTSDNKESTNSSIKNEEHNGNSINDEKEDIKPKYLGVIFILLLIILIAIIIIMKKKLSNKGDKLSLGIKVLLGIIIMLILLAQGFIVAKATGHKGQLNGDKEIDYKDISILEEHLIDLKQLPESLLENGDINSDGEITVTDLALLVQKVQDNLSYDVTIQSNIENYYPSKNEEIDFKFTANVSHGESIAEVKINDKYYKIEKEPNTNNYIVKINVGDKAGIKKFNITKVKLSIGKEVDVNFTESLDVLKEKPIIENYNISKLQAESKMKIAFDLKDIDSSVKNAKVEVIEKDTLKVIKEENVVVGKNELEVNLEKNKDYLLKIDVNYDLDTNKLTEHEKDNSGSIVQEYALRLDINKENPEVQNLSIQELDDRVAFNIAFNIKDTDKSITKKKIVIMNDKGQTVFEKEFEQSDFNEICEVNNSLSSKYTVEIRADYDVTSDNSNPLKDQVIYAQTLDAKPRVNILESNVSSDKVEKGQDVKINYLIESNQESLVKELVINDTVVNTEKNEDNRYEATIPVGNNAGVKELNLTKVIFEDGIEVSTNKRDMVEVLKSIPTISGYKAEEDYDAEKLRVSFNIEDLDKSFISGKVQLVKKDGSIEKEEPIKSVGENNFEFSIKEDNEYTFKVVTTYKKDEAGSDTVEKVLLEEPIQINITMAKELVELKDIESVKVYRKNGDSVEEVNKIDVNDFNPQEYIAEVTMKNIPTLYSEIKEGKVVGKEFRLVLNYDNAVQYEDSTKRNEVEVKFADINNGVAANIGFNELIEIIKKNPKATISLTGNLDASTINVDTATYLGDFQGNIDGNGYVIKNLSKPLFNKLENANVKNLVIEDAKLSGESRGIFANQAVNSEISNVHIKNSSIEIWRRPKTGGLVGSAEDKTIIKECSANNILVQGDNVVGGLVGHLTNGSIVDNCYVKGTVKAGYDAIGGIIGETADVVTLQNSYSDVKLEMSVDWGIGGLVGHSANSKVILKNNISLAYGNHGKTIIGSVTTYNQDSDNNYEIAESNLGSNLDGDKVKSISKNDINGDFLKNSLKWDENIWNLNGATGDKMPSLNNADPTNQKPGTQPQNDNLYIPNFQRISQLKDYDGSREIAYHNMQVLMPFYDANLYVSYGNKINKDDLLNTSRIEAVIVYNQDGKMIAGLNSDNYDSIKKIKIIFEDQQVKEYDVVFKKMLNNVATYNIEQLGIGYSYDKFILNKDISLINEIIDKAKSMDYANDISSVTSEEESRLYVDYYNENVKDKISDIIVEILENEDKYNLYLDNEILKDKIRSELLSNKQLEKLLYTYNYFEKWYKIDIGGIRISDLLYFNSDSRVNPVYDIKKLTEKMLSVDENSRKTEKTADFYDNAIKLQTNKSLQDFFEYLMKIEGIEDPDQWFADNFKGILEEVPVAGKESEINYRAWTLLNKRNEHLLPILTAPQEEMYIISIPSQVIIGSMNKYRQYVEGSIEEMKSLIESYSKMINNFYSVSSSFIANSTDILNSTVHIQYDSRIDFPNKGTQNKGTTQDPVIKWVYEAVNRFCDDNYTAAYANGTDVYWVVDTALGGNYNFAVFSHETAHNQDGYYFYEGHGRRDDSGAEDHADENIAQDLGEGSFVFNLRNDFNIEDDISTNIKLDRINSKDKVHSYYKEMFETYYVLDYLTAKALLQLTPEQQAKLVTQANYVDDNNPADGGKSTEYKKLTADEIRSMHLQSIEDLWNNRIVLRKPGRINGEGTYGGDTHYNIYWYQPHNDNGRPDSYTFRRLGFEMLGVGGYTNGYVAFLSKMSKNDLEALRTATGNPDITWKEYKMNRFKNVEDNLKNVKYFDTDDAIKLYKEALIKDSTNNPTDKEEREFNKETNDVRRVLYGIVKRATGDFTHSSIYKMNEVTIITSAEQLINSIRNNPVGNYVLASDIDFTNINNSQEAAYIPNTFLGTFDGNGHKINGLSKPLFNKVTYANIKNVTIESPNYVNGSKASLIIESKNSMVENLKINNVNANANIPVVGTVHGSLQMSKNIQNSTGLDDSTNIDNISNVDNTLTVDDMITDVNAPSVDNMTNDGNIMNGDSVTNVGDAPNIDDRTSAGNVPNVNETPTIDNIPTLQKEQELTTDEEQGLEN